MFIFAYIFIFSTAQQLARRMDGTQVCHPETGPHCGWPNKHQHTTLSPGFVPKPSHSHTSNTLGNKAEQKPAKSPTFPRTASYCGREFAKVASSATPTHAGPPWWQRHAFVNRLAGLALLVAAC